MDAPERITMLDGATEATFPYGAGPIEYIRADIADAERDAAFALGLEAVAERLDLAEHDAEERDWRSGANAFSALAKAARNAAPMTPLWAALALPEVRELVEALNSIARNTCCERCQEAALVARAVLAKLEATK